MSRFSCVSHLLFVSLAVLTWVSVHIKPNDNDKEEDIIRMSWQHLSQPYGRVYNEEAGLRGRSFRRV